MRHFYKIIVIGIFIVSCNTSKEIKPSEDVQKILQETFLSVQNGETILLGEGVFEFTSTLSLDGKSNITIKGKGPQKTILSFKNQNDGAEGLKIRGKNIILEGFAVEDSKGDAIKAQDTDSIIFRKIRVEWKGEPKTSNGSYGLYPVTCKHVLIENCTARGASDAGIYVGQSENVIVKNNIATENVAGIEIENSTNVEVFDNQAYNNTGGILVFDLPNLPKKNGGKVLIKNNTVKNNNYQNFAPKGTTVSILPSGTGTMVLACREVTFKENKIENHQSIGLTVVSYPTTGLPLKDDNYNPFAHHIIIENNTIEKTGNAPDTTRPLGQLLYKLFKNEVPNILFDGLTPPSLPKDFYSVCLKEQKGTFINLDAANEFKKPITDKKLYECK
jgi:parallel beta-helix repeat protein